MFRLPLDIYFKIFFYTLLVVYHAIDVYFDWAAYQEIYSRNSFITTDRNTTGSVLLATCIAGTLLSALMVFIAGYYIKFHQTFLRTETNDRPERVKINQSIVSMEFVLSLCELFYKDLVQSSILFIAFSSGEDPACVSKTTRAFTLCCVFANVKLVICFCTKLCGLGVGEEINSVSKALACAVGAIGAVIGLFFATLYYSHIDNHVWCADI